MSISTKRIKLGYNGKSVILPFPRSFTELCQISARVYNLAVRDMRNPQFFYYDNEFDKINVSSNFDFDQALMFLSDQGYDHLAIELEQPCFFDLINETTLTINLDPEIQSESEKKYLTIVRIECEKEAKIRKYDKIHTIINNILKKKAFQKLKEKTRSCIEGNIMKSVAEKVLQINLNKYKKIVFRNSIEQSQANVQKIFNTKLPNKNTITIHFDTKCYICLESPIIGIRYNCTICESFDLCSKCEDKHAETHSHAFIKMRQPQNVQNRSNITKFHNLAINLKAALDLSSISDEKIYSALDRSNGELDQAIFYLFD